MAIVPARSVRQVSAPTVHKGTVEWGRSCLVDELSEWVLSVKSKGAAGCCARNASGQVGFERELADDVRRGFTCYGGEGRGGRAD